MGASAIEQIYLPNCLCASGIKPTKSQKSGADWVYKLARSTSAQAGEILPRTTPGYHRERRLVSPRTTPGYHRDRRLVSPRMTPAITGVQGSRHRTTLQVPDT